MKPDFMKHAVLVPFLVCADSLAVRAEAILGRFQPEDEVARAVVGLTGPARVNLNAVRIVDLAGRKGDELVLAFELRVTRHDGKSDRHALDFVRNGRVKLFDTTGKKVFEADSPLQKQVPPMDRAPGVWMTARCPLDGLAANSGRLEVAELFDYNDIPHKAEQTGIDYEVRNARIELKPSPADDLSRYIKAVESTKPLTTCNPVDIEYMIDHGNGKVGSDGLPQGVYVQSADPAIVVFKGEYWLFASHGDGYWFSSDLAKWTFVQIDVTKGILKEFLKYAPATCVVGDTLYLCHSEGGRMPVLDKFKASVRASDRRMLMPGVGRQSLSCGDIEDSEPDGDKHPLIIAFAELSVHIGQDRGRRQAQITLCPVLDQSLGDHHKEGCRNSLAGNIRHDQNQVVFVRHKEIVEVPAHFFRRVHSCIQVKFLPVGEGGENPGQHVRLDLRGNGKLRPDALLLRSDLFQIDHVILCVGHHMCKLL